MISNWEFLVDQMSLGSEGTKILRVANIPVFVRWSKLVIIATGATDRLQESGCLPTTTRLAILKMVANDEELQGAVIATMTGAGFIELREFLLAYFEALEDPIKNDMMNLASVLLSSARSPGVRL